MGDFLSADEACVVCGEVGPTDDFHVYTEPVVGKPPRRAYCKAIAACALRMLAWSADLVRQDLDAALLRRGAA